MNRRNTPLKSLVWSYDYGKPWIQPGNCVPMSTAIARIYTPDGFVVAADGRAYNSDKQKVVSDSVQKIFCINQPSRVLMAYTLAGNVGLAREDSEVIFDFVTETAKAVETLSPRIPKTVWHYAKTLSDALLQPLALARKALKRETEGEPETWIFLDGYYDGRPKRAHIKFDNQQVPEVGTEPELYSGQVLGYGSQEIFRLMASDDPRLEAYRTPPRSYDSIRLPEAVEIAKQNVRAHGDPEALKIDPKCAAMGGRTLIATITYDGFKWVPGCEPLQIP
jgi:hypothetical protein